MADIRTLKLNLLADTASFTKGLKGANKAADGFAGKLGKAAKVGAAAFAVAGVAIGKYAFDAIKAASDLNEETSKSAVIFGKNAKAIQSFSKKAATSLGLSEKAALEATSTFATLGKASGLSGTKLEKFATNATTLAADLGSFYNTSADEAITAIGAALRGESEPIRRFGVLLNDATLKAKAMEMGLYDGKGALDVQAKSLAAYQVILDQTKDAQGDFARTSGGLAAQQKILKSELDNLSAGFGQTFLPAVTQVVTYASQTLLPIIKNVADGFAGKPNSINNKVKQLGRDLGYGDSSGAYNLGQSLRDVADGFGKLFGAISGENSATSNDNLQNFANAINAVATGINNMADALKRAKSAYDNIPSGLKNTLGSVNNFAKNLVAPVPLKMLMGARANGGPVTAGGSYLVGERGPEIFTPRSSGSIAANGSGGNTFIFNGVVDGESARRSIERLFQQSSRYSGAANFSGAIS